MRDLPVFSDPNLLVGAEHFGDAGVYRIAENLAIVQSLDFFPPLVDDPYMFGQIAAANAMSDIYAMGAQPKTALNIVGFPDRDLPLEMLTEILKGGAERVKAAGAVIVGGHSVRDVEVKYGLSVTGLVDPARMLTNEAARPGDVLVLSKALGTGFITAAVRKNSCPPESFAAACESMIALNAGASRAALAVGARGATDITGFGLAGHACELARASGVSLHVRVKDVPGLPGVEELLLPKFFTRANEATREHLAASVRIEGDDPGHRVELIFDPQTSGGLLVAVPSDRVAEFLELCRRDGAKDAAVIGEVVEKAEYDLLLQT